MGTAVAPLAGFNSTMQLLKRQLSKIIVLVEFVIYGGLRTPWVYSSSYALIVRFYRNHEERIRNHETEKNSSVSHGCAYGAFTAGLRIGK